MHRFRQIELFLMLGISGKSAPWLEREQFQICLAGDPSEQKFSGSDDGLAFVVDEEDCFAQGGPQAAELAGCRDCHAVAIARKAWIEGLGRPAKDLIVHQRGDDHGIKLSQNRTNVRRASR
jgi:hypothetical protein